MKKNLYTIVVIILAYNKASMLKNAIESVSRQDYPNITHIVVTDDGSTDNTREVIREFQKKQYGRDFFKIQSSN